jgi:rhodanese-related sulfurtransferase
VTVEVSRGPDPRSAPGRPVVVPCEGGYRSAIGVSLLQQRGRKDARDLVGGFRAWLATQPPGTAGTARD